MNLVDGRGTPGHDGIIGLPMHAKESRARLVRLSKISMSREGPTHTQQAQPGCSGAQSGNSSIHFLCGRAFEEQCERFPQILARLLDAIPLACHVEFGTERYVTIP